MSVTETGTSKYFIDLAKVFENENSGNQAAALLANRIQFANIKPDIIVGHNLIRVDPQPYHRHYPLAQKVSEVLGLPFAVFLEEQNTEIPSLVETVQPGQRAVIVNDVVRTGHSILRTAKALRERNVGVNFAFVYISRLDGNKLKNIQERLRQEDLYVDFIMSARTLLKNMKRSKMISSEQFTEAMSDEDFK